MVRQVIHIDEEKCTGCGICANACHEGAIDIVDGKAKLVRENFCDGFGDCLPSCPAGAITFETREAPEYDEAAVQQAKAAKTEAAKAEDAKKAEVRAKMEQMAKMHHAGGGCPGSRVMQINRAPEEENAGAPQPAFFAKPVSRLTNWPVQIKLAPLTAPYFERAKLLIAADCTAYAYAAFHEEFIRGKVTLIGCPKLDDIDYSEKLTAIIKNNDIRSVTIVRMEVPCCGGLERAAKKALQDSGKFIPWQVVTVGIDGNLQE